MLKIDFTKPIAIYGWPTTKVRILCTDADHEAPIIGIAKCGDHGEEAILRWDEYGKEYGSWDPEFNLINVPREYWISLYAYSEDKDFLNLTREELEKEKVIAGDYSIYSSKQEALLWARADHPTYIGTFNITEAWNNREK